MKQHGLVAALAVVIGLVTQISIGQEILFLGSEFQVNSYTSFDQERPAVAVRSDGSFFIVWQSDGSGGTDTGSSSIQARDYLSDGTPAGDDFQLNTYTTGTQRNPEAVSHPPDDLFINVVWDSWGSDGNDTNDTSVQMRRFRGQFSQPEFQVNTDTASYQEFPKVAAGPKGHFVVAWDTFDKEIRAQRFASNGIAEGGEFRVDSGGYYYQGATSAAVGPLGNFVVTWTGGSTPAGPDSEVFGQRFASDGSLVGGEFLINTYTTGDQFGASVAADTAGNFVVAWVSDGSFGTDSSYYSIQGQRYGSNGTAVGGEFQVNSYTTGWQWFPSVAFGPEGAFLVVWESGGTTAPDGSGTSIQGRLFHSDGVAATDEFQINSFTAGAQQNPSVAADPVDRFVVVWQSDGSFGTDTSLTSIQGQRLIMPLFADGFESGDTSVWSSSVP